MSQNENNPNWFYTGIKGVRFTINKAGLEDGSSETLLDFTYPIKNFVGIANTLRQFAILLSNESLVSVGVTSTWWVDIAIESISGSCNPVEEATDTLLVYTLNLTTINRFDIATLKVGGKTELSETQITINRAIADDNDPNHKHISDCLFKLLSEDLEQMKQKAVANARAKQPAPKRQPVKTKQKPKSAKPAARRTIK